MEVTPHWSELKVEVLSAVPLAPAWVPVSGLCDFGPGRKERPRVAKLGVLALGTVH